jgi:hypothetical protein
MVSFRVGDTYLDYDGAPLGMIYRSSILDINASAGNRSFSIKFPFTSTNDRVFQFARYEDTGKGSRSFDCELMYNGGTLHSGRLVLFNTGEAYHCYFYPSSISLSGLSRTLDNMLSLDEDINLGSTPTDVATAAQSDAPGDGYCWPSVYAPEFYGDKMTGWTGGLNPKANGPIANLLNTNAGGVDNKFSFAPMLYLTHILEKIGDFIGYRVTGDLLEDDRFKRFALFNNRPIDERGGQAYRFRGSARYVILPKYFPNFLHFQTVQEGASYRTTDTYTAVNLEVPENVDVDYSYYTAQEAGTHRVTLSDVFIDASTGALSLAASFSEGILTSSNHNVEITLKLVRRPAGGGPSIVAHVWQTAGRIRQIERDPDRYFGGWQPHELNLDLDDDLFFQVESLLINLSTGETESIYSRVDSMNVKIENISTAELNVWAKSFNKLETVPDVEIKDFLQSIKQWFAVLITPNEVNKTLRFTRIESLLKTGASEDWSDKAVGRPRIDFSKSKHHEWKCNDQDLEGDVYRQEAEENDVNTVTVSPSFEALRSELQTTNAAAVTEYMFVSGGKAISPDYGLEDTRRELRFIELPADNQDETSRRTFRDAIEYYWRETAKVLVNAEPVTIPLRLTSVDLQNLDFTKKKLINGTEYLLLELRVSYETNKIGDCFGEFIKLNHIE